MLRSPHEAKRNAGRAVPDCASLDPGYELRANELSRAAADRRVSALHQDRAAALRALVLAHYAQPLCDLGIGLEQAAEIAPEPVLVELLVGLDVPQPARIGGDLVRHHDPHHLVLPQPAGLHL